MNGRKIKSVSVCGYVTLVVPIQPPTQSTLRKHHPLPLGLPSLHSSTKKSRTKSENKMKLIINTIILLSIVVISTSCRTTHKADTYARRFEIGIDSCRITNQLSQASLNSHLLHTITLREWKRSELTGDTIYEKVISINSQSSDSVAMHIEKEDKQATHEVLSDSVAQSSTEDITRAHSETKAGISASFTHFCTWLFCICLFLSVVWIVAKVRSK